MGDTKLSVRLNAATMALIQQAAQLRNQSITEFVTSALAESANKVVAEQQRTALSNRDRDLFLKLLDAPPQPNKALQDAAARYRKQTTT